MTANEDWRSTAASDDSVTVPAQAGPRLGARPLLLLVASLLVDAVGMASFAVPVRAVNHGHYLINRQP